jgi:UTP--glucose-1-phosphate uridylyltransferase
MITKAIIPAAGKGTRLYPLTLNKSKEMIEIENIPTLVYIIKEAIDSGINHIYLIINENKKDIINYFNTNDFGIKIDYIYQSEQLGLGHAVLQAKPYINEDFACLLGDDLFVCETPALKQLINIYNIKNSLVLGTLISDSVSIRSYGASIIESEGDYIRLKGLIEKPKGEIPSLYASQGRYILKKEIFDILESTKPGALNEIQLSDSINEYVLNNSGFICVIDGIRFDIGNLEGIKKAQDYFKNNK